MTELEAIKIIQEEDLRDFNWFNNHDFRPNEVEIVKLEGVWTVATTDEKAARISQVSYVTESEALDDFIERSRADKLLNEYYK